MIHGIWYLVYGIWYPLPNCQIYPRIRFWGPEIPSKILYLLIGILPKCLDFVKKTFFADISGDNKNNRLKIYPLIEVRSKNAIIYFFFPPARRVENEVRKDQDGLVEEWTAENVPSRTPKNNHIRLKRDLQIGTGEYMV